MSIYGMRAWFRQARLLTEVKAEYGRDSPFECPASSISMYAKLPQVRTMINKATQTAEVLASV